MIVQQTFYRIKEIFKQSEGLEYLQIYNLLKTAGVAIISIIFAKYIQSSILINQWETYLLLGSSFTFFFVSGMGYTLVSFVKQHDDFLRPIIFRSAFQILVVLGILSAVGICLTGHYIPSYAYPLSHLIAYSIFSIGVVCSTLIEYIYYLNKSYKKLIVWGAINLLVYTSCATLPLIMGLPFEYTLYALAGFGIIKFGFTLTFIEHPFNFHKSQYFKPLLHYNWPIISSLLFGTGYIYLANFILKAQVSDQDFNIFRYGSREFPLFMVLANSFSIVLGGLSAEKYNAVDYWSNLRKSHRRLLHQIMPLACLFILSSQFIFATLFSETFIPSAVIFNILTLTVVARVLFPQSILLGLGNARISFYASIFEFAVGLLMVVVLTPIFGIAGAACGLVLAYFAEKSLLIYFCYKQHIPFHKSIDHKWLIIYTILLLFCFLWSMFSN